jgi:colanic acid/amylovoran biosynthesis protein
MRILVDQSGHELQNMGDIAMLQSCVSRLLWQWPDADITVIARSAALLAEFCPDASPIWRASDRRLARCLPGRYRSLWQTTVPYLSAWVARKRISLAQPRTALQAVRAADAVVAAGGGYLTDVWRWQAMGVLGGLSMAQRLGKPTAMFGQGIGPIRHRMLRMQARAVLPRLAVLGLREGLMGRDLALSLGARPGAVTVTGDDALELIANNGTLDGDALGINLRITRYAGVDRAVAAAVGEAIVAEAAALAAPVVALPVSRHPIESDVEAIRYMLRADRPHADVILRDIGTPEALARAAASCRTIVTGSYHAAVFGLAQGVPCVCITNSRYYDGKFTGLRALFPEICRVIPLDSPGFDVGLRTAIRKAWNIPVPLRAAARIAATQQRDAGRAAYAQFRDMIAGTLWPGAVV